MKIFDVYKHPDQGFIAVKKGFAWPAFFFCAIWAFTKNMWIHGCIFFVILFFIAMNIRDNFKISTIEFFIEAAPSFSEAIMMSIAPPAGFFFFVVRCIQSAYELGYTEISALPALLWYESEVLFWLILSFAFYIFIGAKGNNIWSDDLRERGFVKLTRLQAKNPKDAIKTAAESYTKEEFDKALNEATKELYTHDELEAAIERQSEDRYTQDQFDDALEEAAEGLYTQDELEAAIKRQSEERYTQDQFDDALEEAAEGLYTQDELDDALKEAAAELYTLSQLEEAWIKQTEELAKRIAEERSGAAKPWRKQE